MAKHVNGRFDDYTTSLKIRQTLFHWCYELIESNSSWFISFVRIKMGYYWFERQELLKTANDRYHNCGGNEKDTKYYFENKDVFKEKCKY